MRDVLDATCWVIPGLFSRDLAEELVGYYLVSGLRNFMLEVNAMRIEFKRSGGFAGLTPTAALDTVSLPPDEAHKVQKLVEEADFFHLPASTPAPTRSADAFQYEVTVEEGGKRHTVRTSETAISDALQPLIDYLTKMAKGKR